MSMLEASVCFPEVLDSGPLFSFSPYLVSFPFPFWSN